MDKSANERDAELLAWLLRQPAVKAQAYFWNYSSRTERKKAMRKGMAMESFKNVLDDNYAGII